MIAPLVIRLTKSLSSFRPFFEDEQEFNTLLLNYGWYIDLNETDFQKLASVRSIHGRLSELAAFLEKYPYFPDIDEIPIEELKEILVHCLDVKRAISDLGRNADPGMPPPFNQKDIWEDIGEQILTNIMVETLRKQLPLVYGMSHLSGLVNYEERVPEGEHRIPYIHTSIAWDRIGNLLTNPISLLKDTYAWNKPDKLFEWEKFLLTLHHAILSNRFLSRYNLTRKSVVEAFSQPEYVRQYELHELSVPIISGYSLLDEIYYFIGFGIMPIGHDSQSTPPEGLLITPIIRGGLEHEIFLTPDISFDIAAAAAAGDVFGIKIFPDGVSVAANPGNTAISAKFGLSGNKPYAPWIIAGNRDGHRLELHGFDLEFMVQGKADDPEALIRFRTKSEYPDKSGVQLVIQMDEADSFLQKTAKKQEKIAGGLDLEIVWSSKTGFHFSGRPNFNVELPLHKKLGPVELTQFYFALGESLYRNHKKSIQLRTGLGIKGRLGPVAVQLENTGFSFDFIPYSREEVAALPPAATPPLLGLLDLDFRFAPPLGAGLSINAKAVTGGGYLYCDPDRGEYIGTAQLSIRDKINLKAFGMVLTKPRFSFLLMVSGEFPPLQLGLGFALVGAGGLIGIERGINLPALTAGLYDNSIDGVLFPENPMDNPRELAGKVNRFFPVADGQYTVGLMGKFSWGSKNLITIDAGLIIDFPEPLNIALIGVLRAQVTKKRGGQEYTALQLQANFALVLDFEKRYLRFDAALVKSKLLSLDLQGDMAMRLKYGENPDFVLSVGGFHPSFQPPALDLPERMRRLQIILHSGNPHISVSCYFAITTNTVQFGVGGLFNYEKWGFQVRGELSFDALFQFSPFRFEVGLYLLVAVSWKGFDVAGLEVEGLFAGPSPWRIQGSVKVSFLGMDKTVSLNETWGEEDETQLTMVEVLPLLVEDLRNPGNWERATGRTRNLVTVRRVETHTGEMPLLLHPNELLTVRQSTVPLGIDIDKFGERKPADGIRFGVAQAGLSGEDEEPVTVQNHFAPAQFLALNDEERLGRPAYELFDAGLTFEGLDAVSMFEDWNRPQDVSYKTGIVDVPEYSAQPAGTQPEDTANFNRGLNNNILANSIFGRRAKPKQAALPPISERFAVVSSSDLRIQEKIVTYSETEARQALQRLRRQDPRKRADWIVVPEFETIPA